MSTAQDVVTTGLAGRTYVPPVVVHTIESKYVAQSFRIQVMRPLMRRGESVRLPVVYATDGNFAFDVLKGLALSMQTSERLVPRFILVGIGYPEESPLCGTLLRARDLTFPNYPKLKLTPPPIEGVLTARDGTPDYYGAEQFQQFIRHELIPFVDDKYNTAPGDRTYYGHSAGGGFGLFTLFTQPRLFNRYVISSPGVIYHGKSSAGISYDEHDFVLQYAKAFRKSGASIDGARLYMSVGSEEEYEDGLSEWRLTSSFHRLVAQLKREPIKGLAMTTELLAGETHMTAWPVAFMRGVRAVFA